MKIRYLFVFLLTTLTIHLYAQKNIQKKPDWVIVIHGGAGTINKENMTEYDEQMYTQGLDEALQKASEILINGGTAIDAVEKAINVLEDNPLFNAGRGAVFNAEGINELDASIMDGATLKAGAVAGVTDIKNPISAARRVMTNSNYVMLTGRGASQFAKEQGLKIVDNSYFFTFDRWNDYLKTKEKEEKKDKMKMDIKGTVGCVVLDKYGNLAAGTSTGGLAYKKWNRIGDSPIIGAGTYANNATCAVSCTGVGEYFIRFSAAHDVSALMEYKNLTVDKAANTVIFDKIGKAGGTGGLIAVDKSGNVAMPFNTPGMFRAYKKSTGEKMILMYK